MVYELRAWFDDFDCMYTDDPRVKDMAIRSPELRIAARYYRTEGEREPFAWDIVGDHELLADLAARLGRRGRALAANRAASSR